MSLHAVRNKLKKYWTKEKVFDSLFLVLLCLVYSVVTIINLGDDKAPQTFYRFEYGSEVRVEFSEKVKNPKLVLYSGITDHSSFALSYAFTSESFDKLSYTKQSFEGPFKWLKAPTRGGGSEIVIRNDSGRDIDIGEIAFFSDAGDKLEAKPLSYDFKNLFDEQELVQKNLTTLNSTYFDEIYFAQTAYQYATEQPGYETVHPPLGKIIQSIPIKLTGRMTPFTWRIMGALTGVFIIIATYFLAKEIFKKASFARVAAILVSLSGLHFVQTRVGTVDSYLCFFTILSYLFMAKFINSNGKYKYFVASGFFYGCSFAVKWSGAFAGFGLAAMLVIYLLSSKILDTKKFTFKKLFSKEMRKWIRRGLFCFILIPAIIYCSSYLLFPKTTNAHSLSDVFEQSKNLFEYHQSEHTPHPFSSKWYTWPIALTPMLYSHDEITGAEIYLTANYTITYVSIIGLIITAFFGIRRKSQESKIILLAWLSLFIPYAFIGRTMFLYHYLPASIFAILAIVNIFYQIPEIRKILPAYILAVLISFIINYPRMVGI